jgi:ribosomal protein L37AE/L43A
MKTTFSLGRLEDNDIVIKNSIVGRKHLIITYISDKELLLEDLNSTNHTYVNGTKIIKKHITPNDKISLGSLDIDSSMIFKTILNRRKENQTDFTIEFNEIKKIYEEYEVKVDKLKRKSQSEPIIIRAAITVLVMVLVFIFLGNSSPLRYPLMMMAGIIGGVFTAFSNTNKAVRSQIDILNAKLMSQYKCPKCGRNLYGNTITFWSARGKCDNCGALWTKY